MDYRPKKSKQPLTDTDNGQVPADDKLLQHQINLNLQKELSERIRHRRRSHSMSSRGERGEMSTENQSCNEDSSKIFKEG